MNWEFFSRLSKNDELKSKWLEEISKHQNVDTNGFILCGNHFKPNDFTQKRVNPGGAKELKKDAIPSIFPSFELESSHHFSNNPKPKSPRKFCAIKFCRNECGTNDKQVNFFKVPKEGLKRNQWIESISKHQQYDFYNLNFQVCELHFLSEDFTNKSGARILKPNAFPSVFEDSLSCNAADMQFNTATIHDPDLTYNSDSIIFR